MGYIKKSATIALGTRVKTTRRHESLSGIFTVGTIVTITNIGERGYDIRDDEGNTMVEIGFII